MAGSAVHSRSPVEQLRDIEYRCRQNAFDLPSQEEIKEEWVGIGFRLGKSYLVASLGEVVEILYYPPLARVPGTKSWVRGVANIRGTLLPVMDLQGFLGNRGAMGRRSRILVVDHQGVYSGVIVDEVLGLKHFLRETHTTKVPSIDQAIIPYTRGAFKEGEDYWIVFSMHHLAQTPEFIHVAG